MLKFSSVFCDGVKTPHDIVGREKTVQNTLIHAVDSHNLHVYIFRIFILVLFLRLHSLSSFLLPVLFRVLFALLRLFIDDCIVKSKCPFSFHLKISVIKSYNLLHPLFCNKLKKKKKVQVIFLMNNVNVDNCLFVILKAI